MFSSEKPKGKLMETEKEIALKSEEMDGHNKNSSKDTVPSDSEEISVNPHLNSSSDTMSFFQERKRRHYKSKYEHRRRKTSHSRNSVPNDKNKKYFRHRNRCEQKQQSSDHRNKLETITKQTITQEIHVQKNSFKCIINLNTTVCDHQNSINVEKSQCSRSSKQQRPIPQCRKPLCISSRLKEGTTFHMYSKDSCKAGSDQQTRCSEQTVNLGEPSHMCYKWRRRHDERSSTEKEIKKQFDKPPYILDEDEDHISNKSLDKYSDIPMSYKNVVKDSKKYESKLDTLIKRTKERERKLVEQSRNSNVISPYTDISSGEFPTYSDYAASLHSRSTLILDPQPPKTEYSPTMESLHPIKTEKYSPTSFNKDFDSDFEIKIKSEFNKDSGTYSPMQKFNNSDFEMKIKSEFNKDSGTYSPMQKFNNSDFEMKFKSEFNKDSGTYSPMQKFNNSDFEMKIKSKFIMDSGIYSPKQQPMQKLFDNEEWIKKEIE